MSKKEIQTKLVQGNVERNPGPFMALLDD